MKTIANEPISAIKSIGVSVTDGGKQLHVPLQNENADFDASFAGLTKREHFSALAMQGLVSVYKELFPTKMKDIAENSVLMADYLIKALNKE